MKKITIVLLSFTTFFMVSCSNESEIINSQSSKIVSTEEILPPSLIQAIKQTQVSNSNNITAKTGDNIKFDTDHIAETYKIDSQGLQIFTANQIGFDTNNSVNYGLCYFLKNGVVFDTIIVGTETVSTNIRDIHYYETTWDEFSTIELNNTNQSMRTVSSAPRKNCTGANVAACLQDVYTSHGWVSVWAFVQTAYIPATAAAFAIACAAANGC